jgi:predicted DNA-binding WGR domain protein
MPKRAAVAAPSVESGSTTRLTFVEGSSNKFWQITVEGDKTITTYGKVGTKGVSGEKMHTDIEAAKKFAGKEIAGKEKKGYVISGSEDAEGEDSTDRVELDQPASKKGRTKAADKKESVALEEADVKAVPPPSKRGRTKVLQSENEPEKPVDIATPSTESGATTRLTCTEGNSSKFWQITVEGDKTITAYGKIGSNGVTGEKSHKDAESAKNFALKEIAGKQKKGYAIETSEKAVESSSSNAKADSTSCSPNCSKCNAKPAQYISSSWNGTAYFCSAISTVDEESGGLDKRSVLLYFSKYDDGCEQDDDEPLCLDCLKEFETENAACATTSCISIEERLMADKKLSKIPQVKAFENLPKVVDYDYSKVENGEVRNPSEPCSECGEEGNYVVISAESGCWKPYVPINNPMDVWFLYHIDHFNDEGGMCWSCFKSKAEIDEAEVLKLYNANRHILAPIREPCGDEE